MEKLEPQTISGLKDFRIRLKMIKFI